MNMFRRIFGKSTEETKTHRLDLVTDSGMLCVWNADHFSHITDYDSWEKELCEDTDILRHIESGSFVPLNLLSDGAFSVELRVASPDSMSPREKEYLLVPSLPYLLKSSGRIVASGLEHVGASARTFLEMDLPLGDYAVRVNLIDWSEEPGSRDDDGKPSPAAMPDMIVFIEPIHGDPPVFRKEVETFRREDALR